MENKKNYLDEIAGEVEAKKPASFSEEKFERIEKPGIKLDPKKVGIIVAIVFVLSILAYFLFFAPNIEMPDFIGQTKTDVGAWAQQEKIESTGIVFKEEYSFEVAEGEIISQSVNPGTNIDTAAKITFTESLGPDPTEAIPFLDDVLSLSRDDIEEWEDENKLLDVRYEQAYSDTVEEGNVISFSLHGTDAADFVRDSRVTFNISRGPQPAGTVTLEDFEDKTLAEVESFAKSNNIVLNVVEVYDDEVDAGVVISQSIASGKTMKEGETLTVTVSKGVSIVIPNFTGYTADMLTVWESDPLNQVTIIKKERYDSTGGGTVIAQSIAAGTNVDGGTVLELTISLGLPQLQTNSRQWLGSDYLELVAWVDEQNGKGANLAVGNWGGVTSYDDSYTTPGQITGYRCLNSDGTEISTGCDRPLPIGAKIEYREVKEDWSSPETQPTPPEVFKLDLVSQTYQFIKATAGAYNITLSDGSSELTAFGDADVYKANFCIFENGVEVTQITEGGTYVVSSCD